MIVRAYRDWQREQVVVTFKLEETGNRYFVLDPDGNTRIVEAEANSPVPVYFRLRADVAAALGINIEGEAPDIAPTAWHLTDAIGTRDRMLTLVEKLVENSLA